jgi:hypothetical protein
MEPKINLSLTEKEFSFILETLLFACSVDANADWDYDDTMNIKDLAIKFRLENPSIPVNRINVLKMLKEKTEYNDLHTETLIKYFPEIVLEENFI